MDPENFAVVGQLLGERKKGVEGPEGSHYEGEQSASTFFSDGFRSNQQHDPIRDVLKCFVVSDVPVGGPAQSNLRDDEPEKEERRQVQGVLRYLDLRPKQLLSPPTKEPHPPTRLKVKTPPFTHPPYC